MILVYILVYYLFSCRYIVQMAAIKQAVIVSNDNYRDLRCEGPEMREAIDKRLLQYTWGYGDILMFPQDPLGKNGPNLNEFLRF